MTALNKQALRGQSVEGSFYLAECGHCGEMYPSNKLDGGEPLFSGDYGECFCHLCGADDSDIADNGAWGSEVVTARNYQQKRIEALLDELEAAEKRIAELSASHSKLRDTMAGIHNTIRTDGSYTPLAAILNAAKRAHEESATAAGIGVKGSEMGFINNYVWYGRKASSYATTFLFGAVAERAWPDYSIWIILLIMIFSDGVGKQNLLMIFGSKATLGK